MRGYIYKYSFPDGKVYIGQTVRPVAVRHREHITPSTGRVNVGFWEAWERFGEADLDVLETVEAQSARELVSRLNSLEIKYIDKYQALDPEYGYNRASGGHGTSYSRKVLLKAFNKIFPEVWYERGVFYARLEDLVRSMPPEGVQLNEDQTEFIREEALPAISPFYGELIKLSDSGWLRIGDGKNNEEGFEEEEAFEWLLFVIRDIRDMEAEEVGRSVSEFVYSNATEILSEGIIQQLDKAGNVVKEYSSISEVLHELNLSYSTNIYNVLEGKQKTAYGYIWKYKNKS